MKKMILLLTLLLAVALVGNAFAISKGKTVEFAGGAKGKVVFDGTVHADKGLKCGDCHKEGLFKAMKKGSVKITAPHKAGEFCASCHDGSKAFDATKADNCGKCHKK